MSAPKECQYECGREVPPGSAFAECPTCRANINSWEWRRPAEVLARRAKLGLYTSRMKDVTGGRKRS